MNRITTKQLEAMTQAINKTLNAPTVSHHRGDQNQMVPNPGHYQISQACGGVNLVRIESEGGSESDVFGHGHVPKRQLYNELRAMLAGIRAANQQ